MWFSWNLKEHEYQLQSYEHLFIVEKYIKGKHVSFFQEMIRRIKEDIKKLKDK